jgi:subtilisin family serine protease
MDDQRYIVFEVQTSDGGGDEGFQLGQSADRPVEAALSVESLSPADAADARRKPGTVIAEPLPTQLIQPVAKAEAEAAPGPGAAWGIETVGATTSPSTGAGVKVAVLDTGIDAGHPAFQGVTITQQDFTGEGDGDDDGHGTHCAGTIAGRDVGGFRFGVAPGVDELLIGKVLGVNGGSTDAVAQGMQWALQSGANVLSMSLGIDFPGLVARLTAQGLPVQPATSRALEAYRDNLELFGTLARLIRANAALGRSAVVVAATGNESKREAAVPYTIAVSPPAASEGFISVAALMQANGNGGLKVARFSNTRPSLAAPGVDIVSARAGGGFASMSGTSMATPHVAGVAALWAEHLMNGSGTLNPAELSARLVGTSRRVDALSEEDGGAGLVRAPQADD